MHSTNFLYGCDAKEFASLPYKDALNYRIDKGKEQLEELLKIDYLDRDNFKINEVMKAIKHNEALLLEIKET